MATMTIMMMTKETTTMMTRDCHHPGVKVVINQLHDCISLPLDHTIEITYYKIISYILYHIVFYISPHHRDIGGTVHRIVSPDNIRLYHPIIWNHMISISKGLCLLHTLHFGEKFKSGKQEDG